MHFFSLKTQGIIQHQFTKQRGRFILAIGKSSKLYRLINTIEQRILHLFANSLERIFHPQYIVNRFTTSNVKIALKTFATNSKILDV